MCVDVIPNGRENERWGRKGYTRKNEEKRERYDTGLSGVN
jgi:hypothetical protein